jgi:Ca2+-binding EF-hand superfamily protein
MSNIPNRPHDVIIDDFRAILRSMASDNRKDLMSIIQEVYDKHTEIDDKTKKKYLTSSKFEMGSMNVKIIRQKFSKEDLQDVFDECDSSRAGKVTLEELLDFCQRTISKARVLAVKTRSAIIQEFHGNEGDYRRLFASLCASDSQFADKVPFIEFVEDMLEANVSDNDGIAIYNLFDINGDGKVSVEDFVGFIVGQSAEASKALMSQNMQAIVDIKVSANPAQEAEYLRIGYEQLLPDAEAIKNVNNGASNLARRGSFGKEQSVWIWRKQQGTCLGRLRPIIDIQLDSATTSSALVLSGYTCIPQQIAGQWLWIKRAFSYEEENDAIIALRVSLGRMKSPGDRIWTSPGVGWIRVDGNFAKVGMFSSFDAFLWFQPGRTRSADSQLTSPIRSVVGLSEEKRLARISVAVRSAVRYYIPLNEMKSLSAVQPAASGAAAGTNAATSVVAAAAPSTRNIDASISAQTAAASTFDYAALYNRYDSSRKGMLAQSQFMKLLLEVGIRLDNSDIGRIFRFLDIGSNGALSRDEFAFMLKLSDYEIDLVVDQIRSRLISLSNQNSFRSESLSSEATTAAARKSSSNNGTIISSAPSLSAGNNKIRESKALSSIFRLMNRKGDGILSKNELVDFLGNTLNLYITEEESVQVLHAMDVSGDDRIEEKDFIGFMKTAYSSRNEVVLKKAQRLHSVAGTFRRWLQRRNAASKAIVIDQEWAQRYSYVMRSRFPGFLSSNDMMFAVHKLGVHLSFIEARELILIVSPERAGRVQNEDLVKFVNSSCRTLGELLSILTKESVYLKDIVNTYKKYREAYRTEGFDDRELAEKYYSKLRDMMKQIQGISATKPPVAVAAAAPAATNTNHDQSNNNSKQDVVSIAQLKSGFESNNTSAINSQWILNLEEWAALACLAGADIADEDSHGVHVREFIDNLVKLIVNGGLSLSNNIGAGSIEGIDEKTALEFLSKDLLRMIHEEAKAAAKNTGKLEDKKTFSSSSRPDYYAAFQLFDEDGQGSITVEEFRKMLVRLQLIENVSDRLMSQLIVKFDKEKKGYINFDDFSGFISAHRHLLDDDDEDWEDNDEHKRNDDTADDDLNVYGLATQSPPTAVTRNPECDWFLWYLWRQACRIEPSDPESVITELEAACAETEEISHSKGNINAHELWDLLHEMKLITGSFTKAKYDGCIAHLLFDGPTKQKKKSYTKRQEFDVPSNEEEVDYEAMCRYIVRMGRAFNASVQEQIRADDKRYKELKTLLRQQLLDEETTSGLSNTTGGGSMPKYEKVFRRLDADGDGNISMQEFKIGLKKLKHRNEKDWNMKMVRRLFEELDKNHDNSISVKELTSFLREGDTTNSSVVNSNYDQANEEASYQDDEDDLLFVKQRILSDSELMAKVVQILQDLVPVNPQSSTNDHLETVKDAVRRFFQRADNENRGIVTEERFRAFLR